jgi:hypothetical protein
MCGMTATTVRGADIADWGEFAQVTALCSTSRHIEEKDDAKRSGQREHALDRRVITDPSARRRKYAIETGYDARSGRFLRAPLEPWTCDNAPAAMLLYQQVMAAPDASLNVWDFRGADLRHLEYLEAEQLVMADTRGWISMLGDPDRPTPRRRYPGAPVTDKRASVGRQLRGRAKELVLSALIRLRKGTSLLKLSRSQRREMSSSQGVPLGARWITWEANLVKQHLRPDLSEHRYLSIDTCGRWLRRLAALGLVLVVEPARRYRAGRRWQCKPAVYLVADGVTPVMRT